MRKLSKNPRFKRIIAILLVITFLFTSIGAPAVFAAEAEAINDSDMISEMEKANKDQGIFKEAFGSVLISIIGAVQVGSLNNTVFGDPYEVWWASDQQLGADGVFYVNEWENVVDPMIKLFAGSYVLIMALAIMVEALRYNMNVISNRDKSSFWETVHIYTFSAIFMGSFPLLLDTMFALNNAIVGAVGRLGNVNEIQWGACFICGGGDKPWESIGILGFLILFLIEFGVSVFIQIIYVARKLIILMLIVLIPIVAMSLLFPKTRMFFGTWLKELAGNIFLPSIHATILTTFALMANMETAGFGLKLAMLLLFVPITGMVQAWLNLGDGGSKMGQNLTRMGAASIGGAMLLSGMMKRGASGLRGGPGGGGNKTANSSTPENMHSDANMTGISGKATGKFNPRFQGFKKGAMLTGAIAGGLVGAPMGASPVTAAVGGMAMGGAVQGMRQARGSVMGVAGATRKALSNPNTGKMEFGRRGSALLNNVKTNFSDPGHRRDIFGDMGESIGTLAGERGAVYGRSMGQKISGASQQSVLQHRAEAAGLIPKGTAPTLENIAKHNPGKQIDFKQTNQGSWFEVAGKDGSAPLKISSTGAADANLRKGQIRSVSYRLPNAGETIKPGMGGTATLETSSTQQGAGFNSNITHSNTSQERIASSGSVNLIRTGDAQVSYNDSSSVVADNNFDAGSVQADNYFAVDSAHQRMDQSRAEMRSNQQPIVYKAVGAARQARANKSGVQHPNSNQGANTRGWANGFNNGKKKNIL